MSEFIAASPKTSSRHKYISINSVCSNLGSDICSGLPSFHSFTGVDSTCSFFKQSKKDWLGKWLDFPMKEELNEKFPILSKCSKKDIVDDCHLLIQRFVVCVYVRKFDFIDLDEFRYQVFVNSSSNDFRTSPPSKDVLFQHLLRASYQSGRVWGNTLLQEAPPQKESWEWRIHGGNLKFKWKTIDCFDKLVTLAAVCQCRSNKCLNCKCAKNNINCLGFCNCSRKCHNICFLLFLVTDGTLIGILYTVCLKSLIKGPSFWCTPLPSPLPAPFDMQGYINGLKYSFWCSSHVFFLNQICVPKMYDVWSDDILSQPYLGAV